MLIWLGRGYVSIHFVIGTQTTDCFSVLIFASLSFKVSFCTDSQRDSVSDTSFSCN